MKSAAGKKTAGICLTVMICVLCLWFMGPAARADSDWHLAMMSEARSAAAAPEGAVYYLAWVDADEIPELIINYGSVAAGEEIFFWHAGALTSQLYEYYAFNYIPRESMIDIAGGRMGGYYDEVYRYAEGAMQLAASGQYYQQDPGSSLERDETGHFVMNDQFTYTWQGMSVSGSQYVAALNTVFDRNRSVTPYGTGYDLDGLDAALTQAEQNAGAGGMQPETDGVTPVPFAPVVPDEGGNGGNGSMGSVTGFDAICAAAAQNTPGNLQYVSSDVSEYPAVKLYLSFTDEYAEPITMYSMTAGIKEQIAGGQEIERTVRYIERLEGNQGLSIDIVADKSASMDNSLGTMQWIMSQFVQSLDYASGDKAEIISFDSYIMYMCTYTQDVNLLQNGIYNMTPYGNTALYDALATGIRNAGSQAGARCVIGFTDGQDNESSYTANDVISLALQEEVPVYLIGTQDADAWQLQSICEATGGRYWSVGSITDVSEILQEIYSNQKDMYCVCYESDPGADPYAQRTFSCVVADDTWIGRIGGVSFSAVPAISKTTHASRYEVVRADVTWEQANEACIAKGGHLATITSPEEMQQLSSLAASGGVRFCWLGGYTSVRNNTAFGHWITGEPFNYTAWYPGEPSRNDKDGTPEFYLMLWYVEDKWSWNDQRNDVIATGLSYFVGTVGYIIEYEQ